VRYLMPSIVVSFAATVAIFMFCSLGRTIYVNSYEFNPAVTEWHAAHDRNDLTGIWAAYRKEVIAHCRTVDPFWFYSKWANKCEATP
jgi:hypothetical protein